MPDLNPEQFGMSEHEARRMAAKAEGEHVGEKLWEGVQGIFGNIKVQGQSRSYDNLRERFPTHEIKMDNDNWPYVEEKHGAWRAQYFDAPNISITHRRHGEQDSIDIGDEHKTLGEDGLKQHLRRWHREYGRDYEQHLDRNRPV